MERELEKICNGMSRDTKRHLTDPTDAKPQQTTFLTALNRTPTDDFFKIR